MFQKLKEIRTFEGLTQEEIAKRLNVKRSTYAGWESGKDIIPLRKLNDLANIYDVTLDYLVGLTENQENRHDKMDIDPKVVSENIKLLRLSRKLTQKELAESLKTSQSNIHNYENGKSLITTMYAIELAKNYDYSLDKLIQKTK